MDEVKSVYKEKYMREIKFRAWQPFSKKMYYTGNDFKICVGHCWDGIEEMPWLGSERISQDSGVFGSCVYGNNTDTSLMQYTGLRDKNGKEIYEGDIVDGSHFFGSVSKDYYVVTFGEEGGKNLPYWKLPMDVGVEIIGNIYENPELLNHG